MQNLIGWGAYILVYIVFKFAKLTMCNATRHGRIAKLQKIVFTIFIFWDYPKFCCYKTTYSVYDDDGDDDYDNNHDEADEFSWAFNII